jgi:preprotein translocase subunit SecG
MLTLITILHLFVAVLLIVLVLVQDSKGDGMGTTFGGGNSGSVLGATGAVSFLGKATRIVVVIFAATAIILTRMTAADQGSHLNRSRDPQLEVCQVHQLRGRKRLRFQSLHRLRTQKFRRRLQLIRKNNRRRKIPSWNAFSNRVRLFLSLFWSR